MRERPKTLLIISQTFVPDPASVGQHMADVAVEMARRGHRVLVYASARGYENPENRYPRRENLHGVEIRRFPLASFGKKTILLRILGTASFMLQAIWAVLTTPNLGGIFFSTSPPLIGIAAVIGHRFRRVPIAYWAMDLNPDQLIAMKKIEPDSPIAQTLEFANRLILRDSSLVVALDRFMANRLRTRVPGLDRKMLIAPPWPHDHFLTPVAHEENPFRQRLGLDGKFVIMYSGNHSPANPLQTLLEAAVRLKDHPQIVFMFIGGGLGKKEVEAFALEFCLRNVIMLPYQPMSELRYSLSAADVHVVSLGQNMVGIVHPCKIYGAMSIGRPILFLGPRPSHISDILDQSRIGRHIEHGDVNGAIEAIRQFADAPAESLHEMGSLAQQTLSRQFTQARLCGEFCDRLEKALKLGDAAGEAESRAKAMERIGSMTRTIVASLLLLGLLMGPISCQTDVREVRRTDYLSPEAPGSGGQARMSREAPEAPSGNPVAITGTPVTPGMAP